MSTRQQERPDERKTIRKLMREERTRGPGNKAMLIKAAGSIWDAVALCRHRKEPCNCISIPDSPAVHVHVTWSKDWRGRSVAHVPRSCPDSVVDALLNYGAEDVLYL